MKAKGTKLLCAFLFFAMFSTNLFGQGTITRQKTKAINISSSRPLDIGDRLPDIFIDKIVNFPVDKINTDAFRNKLLILDFMATNCKSCIEALPRLDSLQNKFNGQLQVLVVTYEKPEKVKAFLQKNKIGKSINLPFVVEDSLLKKHFPHEYISHVAWINKGKVLAITGTQYVKTGNLSLILNGQPINWPVKRDVTDFDFNAPLLSAINKNTDSSNLPAHLYYATITNNIKGVGDYYTIRVDSLNKSVRIYMVNSSIVDLYLRSWDHSAFPISHMDLEVKDINRFLYNANVDYRDAWEIANTFSYEATFPLSISKATRGEKIRNDLNFYFGLNGSMEKRVKKCYILRRTATSELLRTKPEPLPVEEHSSQINISIPNLVNSLNNAVYGSPILDETGFTEEMYVQLPEKMMGSIPELNKELKKYGLEIIEDTRIVEVFVLKEKPKESLVSNKDE